MRRKSRWVLRIAIDSGIMTASTNLKQTIVEMPFRFLSPMI